MSNGKILIYPAFQELRDDKSPEKGAFLEEGALFCSPPRPGRGENNRKTRFRSALPAADDIFASARKLLPPPFCGFPGRVSPTRSQPPELG